MNVYENKIYDDFFWISNSPKFSRTITYLINRYICLMFAAAYRPINLGIGLGVLYDTIEEAQNAHTIKRQTFDIFVQYFQKDFDRLCDTDFNPKNKSNRRDSIENMNTRALSALLKYSPKIIEPTYEALV